VGGKLSEEGEVGSGVPQGTVLGPCLFSIFIDDAEDCTIGTTNIIKFADDTNFWKVVENDSDRAKLQETLDMLSKWTDQWGMSFNADNAK
jgi:ribonuclease P/MRP protein subunit RPP40